MQQDLCMLGDCWRCTRSKFSFQFRVLPETVTAGPSRSLAEMRGLALSIVQHIGSCSGCSGCFVCSGYRLCKLFEIPVAWETVDTLRAWATENIWISYGEV